MSEMLKDLSGSWATSEQIGQIFLCFIAIWIGWRCVRRVVRQNTAIAQANPALLFTPIAGQLSLFGTVFGGCLLAAGVAGIGINGSELYETWSTKARVRTDLIQAHEGAKEDLAAKKAELNTASPERKRELLHLISMKGDSISPEVLQKKLAKLDAMTYRDLKKQGMLR